MTAHLAVNAVFAGPHAAPAEARPVDGDPFALRVVSFGAPRLPDLMSGTVRREALVLRARVADWPAPATGDIIAVGDALRRVTDASHADPARLTWRLDTEAAPEAPDAP